MDVMDYVPLCARCHGKYDKAGIPKSPETRAKISASRQGVGHPTSPETKEKLRKLFQGENNPIYGKPRSEETKAKIRAAQLAYLARVKAEACG
jgi:NUMOD3 motif